MLAVATASVGTAALLPASTAQARVPARAPICPPVVGLCTWSEPSAGGRPRMLEHAEPRLLPPIRSAKNQTSLAWCLYPRPSYAGRAVIVHPGSYTPGLGLEARSARPC
ncbi:hypothetical protein GCM10018779_39350 [Streptomyces griseocarneus]|nr:hypothetical protein GCM10018779_39350 [Streptomyces griseocarneus]